MDSMVKEIKLKNIKISENDRPFIIAEIGNNHNGEIEIAKTHRNTSFQNNLKYWPSCYFKHRFRAVFRIGS